MELTVKIEIPPDFKFRCWGEPSYGDHYLVPGDPMVYQRGTSKVAGSRVILDSYVTFAWPNLSGWVCHDRIGVWWSKDRPTWCGTAWAVQDGENYGAMVDLKGLVDAEDLPDPTARFEFALWRVG
jgi:hypothetical protein